MTHRLFSCAKRLPVYTGLISAALQALLVSPAGAQQVVANGTTRTATGTISTAANGTVGYGLWALNAGQITASSPLFITVTGASAAGAAAQSAGKITIGAGGASIATTGGTAYGLYATGVGSSINSTGASVQTGGNTAYGVYANAGGTITLNGGSVTTTGTQASGLFAFVNGATITATNTTILTRQNQATGVQANVAGHITLTGGSVTTLGSQAEGLYTIDTNATVAATGTTVSTAGDASHGAHALVGSITLQDVGITTTGAGAFGARVDNQSSLSVTGGSLATQGASSYGVLAIAASTATLTNVAVSTSGGSAPGAAAQFGANLTINGGSVTTTGPTSTGLFAVGMVTVTAVGSTPTASVPDAQGLGGPAPLAGVIGAKITANDVLVQTQGAGSNAAVVRGGSSIVLNNSTLQAQGADGNALFASAYDVNASAVTATGATLSSGLGAAIKASGTTFNVSLDNSTATGGVAALSAVANSGTPAILNVNAGNGSVLTGVALMDASSTSNLTLGGGSVWNMTGSSVLSSLSLNASQVLSSTPAGGTYKTLTLGSLTSAGGVIGLNSFLAGDGSPSDLVVMNGGAASGQTRLRITNAGGAGALTTANGVQVVQALSGGQAAAGAFALDGRAVAGPYEYRLYRGGAQAIDADNWYLRSQKQPDPPVPPAPPEPVPPNPPEPPTPPGPPIPPNPNPEPLYRPEVAAYLANQRLVGQMFVHSMHDRLGEPQFIENTSFPADASIRSSVWMRTSGTWEKSRSKDGNFDVSTDLFLIQGGGDIAQWRLTSNTDRLHLGVMLGYGSADSSARADGNSAKAKGRVDGYSTGLYATWFQNDATKLGAYVDTWAQYGWFNNRVIGDSLPRVDYDSRAWSVSAETGYALALAGNWVLEPQAQVIYVRSNTDSLTEDNGTRVSGADSHGTLTRLGVRTRVNVDLGNGRTVQPFATVNWWHASTDSSVSFNQLPLGTLYPKDRYELKVGANANFTKGWTGWVNVAGAWGSQDYQQYSGRIGVKYAW